MSFPNKEVREKCWNSRDVFWKCLDENPDKQDVCSKFREAYESCCPSQWVKHFDRKREYLKFKDRIQNEGKSPSSPVPCPILEETESHLIPPSSITKRNNSAESSTSNTT